MIFQMEILAIWSAHGNLMLLMPSRCAAVAYGVELQQNTGNIFLGIYSNVELCEISQLDIHNYGVPMGFLSVPDDLWFMRHCDTAQY